MRTKDQAIQEITEAIEATNEAKASEFDLDAIFDQTYQWQGQGGYVQIAGEDRFWMVVFENLIK